MIDLRCHILDGTECGPESFAASVAMGRTAIAEGVRTIVATPRWAAGRDEPPLPFADCRRKLARLETELGGALSMKLGFELQFSSQLPALVERYGSLLALAGKTHLLISLPSLHVPAKVEEVWQDLGRNGFAVIVAQPECSAVLRRDPARINGWVTSGVTLQLDAASVAGAHGRDVHRFAIDCLGQYEGHAVVASNARGTDAQRNSLGKARAELLNRMGARPTDRFMRETPKAIINDERAPADRPGVFSGRLGSLFRSLRPRKALRSES